MSACPVLMPHVRLRLLYRNIVETIRNWPGVVRMDTLRATRADTPSGQVNLAATQNPNIGTERLFSSLQGTSEEVWAAMQAGDVLISEPLANRIGLRRAGGEILLFTPEGWQTFPVRGIFYDYASSDGTVLMALDVYRAHWQDDALTALALRLEPDANPDQFAQGLQDHLQGRQQLLIRPNQALRQDVLEVFDRTFAARHATLPWT